MGVLVAALLILHAHNGQPRYQGRSLETWLRVYRSEIPAFPANIHAFIPNLPDGPGPERPSQKQSADSIRNIGPKALPELVSWLQLHYTPWKTRASAYAVKLPSCKLANHLRQWLSQEADGDRCRLAICGIHILRTNAVTVIPEILLVATNKTAPGACDAIRCLVEIGPPAAPALTNVLGSCRCAAEKRGVLIALEKMGPEAELATLAVAAFLHNPDTNLASQAATTLASIGEKTQIAIPLLTSALDDERLTVRFYAILALRKFGGSALPAVPKLRSLLGTDYLVDDAARMTLQQIAPHSLTNAPARPAWVQSVPPLPNSYR